MIRATVALLLLGATPASPAEIGCAPDDRILAGLAQSCGETVRADDAWLFQTFGTLTIALLLGEPVTPLTLACAGAVAAIVWLEARARVAHPVDQASRIILNLP